MEATDFQALVDQLGGLTKEQREALVEAIEIRASANVGTWSKPKPLTRYMCHVCGRTFTAPTGTPLERLRRRDAWLAYGQALADGISLRKAAKRCGIVLDTAFRWRHRFLKLPKNKKAAAVSGIVEADETYFLKSQKGARKVEGREARKRGGKASKPGLSDEHTPVLIVRDRTGAMRDTMLEKVDTASITEHLGPIVQKDTLLIKRRRQSLCRVCGGTRASACVDRRLQRRTRLAGLPHPKRKRLHQWAQNVDGPLQRRRDQVPRQLSGMAPQN